MEARLEKDHFALDRWCSHFNSSIAISAVQIWISSAFRLVPTKLFTFKVLFEGFEKQFDFPAVLVDGGDGGGPEVQEIGQEDDLALVVRIPNHHTPHGMGAVVDRLGASKEDDFIGQDVAR